MLITHLELEDFKSYQSASLIFRPGTTAIIGPNGVGKSTVVEAIGFALFDYTPPGLRLTDLMREGASSGGVVVGLISSYDERAYEVERRFSNQSTSLYRVYDLELGRMCLADGGEEVRTWLHEHLCVDPSAKLDYLFENTVGVPQGTFTAPFQQPTSARKAVFDPLLQVDEYRKASDGLRPTMRYLEDRANEARQDIARMEGQLETLPRLRDEGRTLQEGIAATEERVKALRQELTETTTRLDALDAAERRVVDIAARLERARGERALQQQLLADAERALREAKQALEQVESSRAGYQAYEAADGEARSLESRRSARDDLRARRGGLVQEEARLAARCEQLDGELMGVEESARQMEALAPAVKQQETLEATLAQARDDSLKLDAARARQTVAEAEVARALEEVVAIKSALQEASDLTAQADRMRGRVRELEQLALRAALARAGADSEIEALSQQSATLAETEAARCPTCEAELTPERRGELLARNKGCLDELRAEVEARMKEANLYQEELEELKGELAGAERRLRELATAKDLLRAQDRLSRHRDDLDSAKAEVHALADAPDLAARRRTALEALGDPRRAYHRHEDQVRRREGLQAERAAAEDRRQTLGRQMQELDGELADYAGLEEALRANRETLERHRQAHETYLSYLNVAQQRGARRDRVAECGCKSDALGEQVAVLAEAHQSAEAEYDAEEHRRVKERAFELKDAVTRAETQLEEARRRLAVVTQEIARLDELQGQLDRRCGELVDAEAIRSLVGFVRDLLRAAGPHVTRQLVHQISTEASSLYSDIMGDYSGWLTWSVEYELSLEVKGHQRTFRQLSGGEQMGAALALRLALLRETSAIDAAFFDEPTAHLDAERREGLAEKMMQVRGFSQIFVISHDDTFEQVAQSTIRIVKDENGSRVEGG